MSSNQHTSEWTPEIEQRLLELAKEHRLPKVTKLLNEEYGTTFTYGAVKSKHGRIKFDGVSKEKPKKYKETVEIKSDGTQYSDRLIELSEEEAKDEKAVLKAHGYDPNEWQIINSETSLWHHLNKKMDNPRMLYASKVRVKPRENKLTDEEIVNTIIQDTKPINLNTVKYKIKDKRMLGIELMDMHFGINTLDDYKDTLTRLTHHLEKRVWEKVVITFGSDLMHVDNLKNTTANGTRIQDVDVVQMIEDVKSFYEYLVTKASKQANQVEVIYIKGNHDETTSGMLIHWLDARFRNVNNVEVDTTIQEVKVYAWEQIFVALTHGDKGGKRTKNTLATNYPLEWARAKVREFHKGHEHHEQVKDEFGITERTLPTRAKVDQFHKDNSYDSAHRRFQIFEYSGDWLESIHYV